MSDIQAAQTRRLLESTGQAVTFMPPDAPHTLHDAMAQQCAGIVTEWAKPLA